MAKNSDDSPAEALPEAVDRKAGRIRHGARQRRGPLWFGLGTFGLVGWSVAVPTLLGIAGGLWIDLHYESRVSWTLTLMVSGVAFGGWQAYYWIRREHVAISNDRLGGES